MLHELKITIPYADAICDGRKRFEVRRNDRGFNAGDYVRFSCIDDHGLYCSHAINDTEWVITYVFTGFGLDDCYVVFGIRQKGEHNRPLS